MGQAIGKTSRFTIHVICRISGIDGNNKKRIHCSSNDDSTCSSAVAVQPETLITTTHDSPGISIQTSDDNSSCFRNAVEESTEPLISLMIQTLDDDSSYFSVVVEAIESLIIATHHDSHAISSQIEDKDHDHNHDQDRLTGDKYNSAKSFGNDNENVKAKLITTVSIPSQKVKRKGKRLMHYYSNHNILLVGEGDFSFCACLAKAFDSAANMVATSLDSLSFLEENYPSARTNIGFLRNRGCTVLHDMDATKMASNMIVNEYFYDRIIFNFPLAGFFNESMKQHLKRNRKLVRLFMENAKKLLASDGEIHITHKTSATYRKWGIEILGKQCRLRLMEEVEFKLHHYPGYNNKYGFGGNDNFNCYPSKTYKFGHENLAAVRYY